jgi:hypothetical protein
VGDASLACRRVAELVELELQADRREVVEPADALAPQIGQPRDVPLARVGAGRGDGPEGLDDALVVVVDDGEEELLLAGEVLVDGAAREPRRLGDLLERRPLEAAPGEDLGRRLDEDVAGLLAPPFLET